MKLLTSQRDEIYSIIENSGLSPSQFVFKEQNSLFDPRQKSTKLIFKGSEFFYLFEHSKSSHYARYCPAEDLFVEDHTVRTWDSQLLQFEYWLIYLIREVNAPNKWERLSIELNSIDLAFESDDTQFSISEYEELQKMLLTVKAGVATLGLSADEAVTINSKLDYLTDSAKKMSKFNWKSLFIGTIVNTVLNLGLTPEKAESIWILIKEVFKTLLLP